MVYGFMGLWVYGFMGLQKKENQRLKGEPKFEGIYNMLVIVVLSFKVPRWHLISECI